MNFGDKMGDGTALAAISPETNKPIYAALKTYPLMTFNEAVKAAKEQGYRLPTRNELHAIWKNSEKGALKGLFNKSGSFPGSIYWSGENFYFVFFDAKTLRMSDGLKCHYKKTRKLSTCFVRD